MKILLDCERMKFPQTGLYYYCLYLGHALKELALEDQLYFYTPPAATNCFGDAHYITQHSRHKFFLPAVKQVDLWHCTFQGSNYFPLNRKIKKVFTIHDLNFLHDRQMPATKKKRYLRILSAKIATSDYVTAISNYTLRQLKEVIYLNDKPSAVIYNGCNIREDIPATIPSHPPAAPFLFTIGTIVDKKNMHVLPALLQGNNYQLVIAGITISEEYKKKIVAEALRFKVSERLIFTGGISEAEKYWYLQNCEAFVFPSLAEGFGLPVVEAMHFGKPIFLSLLSSLPEIGGDAAYYFNSFEPKAMQAVLNNGLADFHSRQRANEICTRAATFSWDAAAKQYLDVYHSIL